MAMPRYFWLEKTARSLAESWRATTRTTIALHQTNVGCFGLFECINDRDVAAALFERAASWLREKGRTEIMGPIDYSTNYVCALLIDGFQFPPTILTSHNPPYYRDLIESCGFTKAKDWYAWWFADPAKAVTQLRRLAARFHSALSSHYSSGKSQESSR